MRARSSANFRQTYQARVYVRLRAFARRACCQRMRECTNSPLTLALGLPCLKSQACSRHTGGCTSPTMLKTRARAPINILPRSANESFRGLLPDRHASLRIGVVNCARPTTAPRGQTDRRIYSAEYRELRATRFYDTASPFLIPREGEGGGVILFRVYDSKPRRKNGGASRFPNR